MTALVAFLPGLVACVGVLIATVALVILCLHGRKKQTHPVEGPSVDISDVEDPRNGFTFDDPYHSIDISDDVKTLSSGNSGDSAFDTSPNHSGHSVEVAVDGECVAVRASSQPPSDASPRADCMNKDGEEAVYEVIAFERDGSVIHNPTPDVALAMMSQSQLNHCADVQTYEDVGDGDADTSEPPPSGSPRAKGDCELGAGDDEVFEEPLYSPVYESTYVDCVSCSSQDRKDSGVVVDSVSSPTDQTPSVVASHSRSHKASSFAITKKDSQKSSENKNVEDTKACSHWASIKSRVAQLRKEKKAAAEQGWSGSQQSPNTLHAFSYNSNEGTQDLCKLPQDFADGVQSEDSNGALRGIPLMSQFLRTELANGQETPRSASKPKPPVPPKPGNKK